MKKLLAIALVLALVLTMVACGSGAATKMTMGTGGTSGTYYAFGGQIMPPIMGAAIAQANPMKSALTATKLAIGAFIVPYVFALNPAMLLIDTNFWEVALICVTSVVGICGVSAALEGFLLQPMHWYTRVLCLAGGLCLIVPGLVTDSIGLGLVAFVVVIQLLTHKKATSAPA